MDPQLLDHNRLLDTFMYISAKFGENWIGFEGAVTTYEAMSLRTRQWLAHDMSGIVTISGSEGSTI